jgi:hypothetical protein
LRSSKHSTVAPSRGIAAIRGTGDHLGGQGHAQLRDPRARARGPSTKGDPEEHDHPEHPPAVAAHEITAAPEGAQAAGSLEHNDGHGHRPDSEQVGAGCE